MWLSTGLTWSTQLSAFGVSVMLARSQSDGWPTVHVYRAGVMSIVSFATARTSNVCVPVVRFETMNGLKHSTQRSGSRVSTRHSYSMNSAGVLGWVAVNENVAARLLLSAGGISVMIVSGGLGSAPSKWWVAGLGATLPRRSIARAPKNIRPPSLRRSHP